MHSRGEEKTRGQQQQQQTETRMRDGEMEEKREGVSERGCGCVCGWQRENHSTTYQNQPSGENKRDIKSNTVKPLNTPNMSRTQQGKERRDKEGRGRREREERGEGDTILPT